MDFETSGSIRHGNRVRKSEIMIPGYDHPIVPDGIFGVSYRGKPMIHVMEIHRTTQTKAVGAQLHKYLDVLATNAVNFKYGVSNVPTYICSVHTLENVLRGAKEILQTDPDYAHFKHLFLFNRADQLKQDFSAGWHEADGTEAYPFPKAKEPQGGLLVDHLF